MSILSDQGQLILDYLVREIRRGRFRIHEPETFCGYTELHKVCGFLCRKFPQTGWGWNVPNWNLKFIWNLVCGDLNQRESQLTISK